MKIREKYECKSAVKAGFQLSDKYSGNLDQSSVLVNTHGIRIYHSFRNLAGVGNGINRAHTDVKRIFCRAIALRDQSSHVVDRNEIFFRAHAYRGTQTVA